MTDRLNFHNRDHLTDYVVFSQLIHLICFAHPSQDFRKRMSSICIHLSTDQRRAALILAESRPGKSHQNLVDLLIAINHVFDSTIHRDAYLSKWFYNYPGVDVPYVNRQVVVQDPDIGAVRLHPLTGFERWNGNQWVSAVLPSREYEIQQDLL